MVFVKNQTIAILKAKTTLFTMIYIKSNWPYRCRVTCAIAILNVIYAKSRLFLEKLLFIFLQNSLYFHSKSFLKLAPLNAPSNSPLTLIRKQYTLSTLSIANFNKNVYKCQIISILIQKNHRKKIIWVQSPQCKMFILHVIQIPCALCCGSLLSAVTLSNAFLFFYFYFFALFLHCTFSIKPYTFYYYWLNTTPLLLKEACLCNHQYPRRHFSSLLQ